MDDARTQSIERAAGVQRVAVLEDLAAGLLEARAGHDVLDAIGAELQVLAATRLQAAALATAKGELVELGAEFADPGTLPSIVCLAESLDAVQDRAIVQGQELGGLCERTVPIEHALSVLETELLDLVQREAARLGGETSLGNEATDRGSAAPEDILLAKVIEARAENQRLQQCRWSREVRAVASSTQTMDGCRTPGLRRKGVLAESVAYDTAHVDFFAVLNEALAHCGPGFSDAIPRLIPSLDLQNASLAESIIQGFEYLEQLARIGTGEVNDRRSASMQAGAEMARSDMLAQQTTPHLLPPATGTSPLLQSRLSGVLLDGRPSRTSISVSPGDALRCQLPISSASAMSERYNLHKRDAPAANDFVRGSPLTSPAFSTVEFAKASGHREGLRANDFDLWGLPQSYM